MPMYNLIEYSDIYSKKSGILWQYCKDKPAVDKNGKIVDFTVANSITDYFKTKDEITCKQETMAQKVLK